MLLVQLLMQELSLLVLLLQDYSCTVQCTAVMSTMTTTSTTTAFPHSLAKSLLLLLIFLHLKGNLLKINVTVCIPFILF